MNESSAIEAGATPLRREAARERLGIAPDETVLAVLSDDPRGVDASRAMFLAGVLELIDRPVSVLIPEGARRTREAARFAADAGLASRVVPVDAPACRWWAAADAVFEIDGSCSAIVGTDAERTLTAWCERLGVPCHRSLGLEDRGGDSVPPVADSLWWRVREGAPPLVAHAEASQRARIV